VLRAQPPGAPDEDPLASLIRRNVAHWEEQRRNDPKAVEWAALHAYLGRLDCDRDFSSAIHAEQLSYCHATFQRLFERDGAAYAYAHPHRWSLVMRFRPATERP
jgi:hypothetical protein